MDAEEVNFNKKLPNFYRMIMLQPLYEKMKEDYGLSSVNDLEAMLSVMFMKKKMKKKDGTEYDLPQRIDHLSFAEQIEALSKVANMAIVKYGIRYPNANEIDGMLKK
jgi:CII-binding regulator of phage lambda lysogenization HflD